MSVLNLQKSSYDTSYEDFLDDYDDYGSYDTPDDFLMNAENDDNFFIDLHQMKQDMTVKRCFGHMEKRNKPTIKKMRKHLV